MRKFVFGAVVAALVFPVWAHAYMTAREWDGIVMSKTQELYSRTGNLSQSEEQAREYAGQAAVAVGGVIQPNGTVILPGANGVYQAVGNINPQASAPTTTGAPSAQQPAANPFSNPLFLMLFLALR